MNCIQTDIDMLREAYLPIIDTISEISAQRFHNIRKTYNVFTMCNFIMFSIFVHRLSQIINKLVGARLQQ